MYRLFFVFFSFITLISCHHQTIAYNDPIPPHDSLQIDSRFVQENRMINVWTPPEYKQSTDSFPVLYMPDGGLREDFPHIANTLAKLIAANKIPPYILVGIENTERGRDLTGFSTAAYDKQFCPLTDGAKNFRAFITDELIPVINKKYRTKNKKGIIGESLAGLFVIETFFIHPEAFDFYIAMDPSLWWNNHFLVSKADSLLATFPSKKIKLWFAGSSAKDIAQYTIRLAAILRSIAPNNLSWLYENEPKEKHNTIFRATKEKALIWTLQDAE
ncbi:MAG: alpha/beta hydrolase-fold protein [Chitinophagaceae bacterium]|nr:alpha/beta hydrolase-fold protein [Chitinophagaceae bacterium]